MILTKKKFLVIGTGRSGSAVTNFLLSKGAYVTLTDVKPKEKLDKEILALDKTPNFNGIYGMQPPASILDDIDYIIMSPGVPMDIPIIKYAISKSIPILGELELAYIFSKSPIIAITGTNGKTTTTSLVGEIFRESQKEVHVVGNIGMPMISQIDKVTKDGYLITEVSSFQLEGSKDFKPYISAILNITPDHLNRHKTMENYIYEKSKIFSNQGDKDITILNADDPITFSLRDKVKGKLILFSRLSTLKEGVFIKKHEIILKDNNIEIKVCDVKDIKMLGTHNLENALAAIAISYHVNMPIKVIKSVLQRFTGVSHRIEIVDTINGIEFINDSKGTNPEASIKAVEAMKKPIVLIAGGMDKGSNFTEFVQSFHGRVRHLILVGETAHAIKEAAEKQGFYNITKVNDFKKAVLASYEKASENDVVLLSPACASWDMFSSFEERGDYFKTIVRSLRGARDEQKETS